MRVQFARSHLMSASYPASLIGLLITALLYTAIVPCCDDDHQTHSPSAAAHSSWVDASGASDTMHISCCEGCLKCCTRSLSAPLQSADLPLRQVDATTFLDGYALSDLLVAIWHPPRVYGRRC